MGSAPGIVGRAVIVIDPDATESKLNGIGFAGQYHPGRCQAVDRPAILGRVQHELAFLLWFLSRTPRHVSTRWQAVPSPHQREIPRSEAV